MRYLHFLLLIIVFTSQVYASDKLHGSDLSKIAVTANQENLPILLKEEIINPMLISGNYEDKVIIAEIFLDSYKNILDFKGNLSKPGVISDSYKVWVTPTLLFLDPTGREIHKRMLGVNTIEMYGHYLDESLAAALRAVHNGDKSYVPTNTDIMGDAPGYDQQY